MMGLEKSDEGLEGQCCIACVRSFLKSYSTAKLDYIRFSGHLSRQQVWGLVKEKSLAYR